MNITFYNMTVTIEADSEKEAYTKLCHGLNQVSKHWKSDTFDVDGGDERNTDEFLPETIQPNKQ